ncbi:MAG TPA: Gfo/Idh/MocA family oxidoreductase [Bacteroidales bacterium]|nr:Gfo/Idh/MocA family oxidoreductase [Bacteroidales bacterium]
MHKIQENKVVWGVIGAGDVCEKKSAPAMNKIHNSRIKAVMRRNPLKAEDFARRHSIPYWYNDVNDILADKEINAVYIATPPDSHAGLTIKAAQAGKAVYVEKPMARTYGECNEMIEACEKAGVPLFVAYYRRALPKFIKLKELIDAGEIGDVRLIKIEMIKQLIPDLIAKPENNWRIVPGISGGGYFHDVASHQLDLIDFLFGPITKAVGFSTNQAGIYPADDIVTGAFSVGKGILGSGSWCFTAAKSSEKERTTITGSKGQIEFSTFGDSPLIVDSEITGHNEYPFTAPEHIEGPMIQRIVEHLLGKAVYPCDGITGARTNRVMEMMCNRV